MRIGVPAPSECAGHERGQRDLVRCPLGTGECGLAPRKEGAIRREGLRLNPFGVDGAAWSVCTDGCASCSAGLKERSIKALSE